MQSFSWSPPGDAVASRSRSHNTSGGTGSSFMRTWDVYVVEDRRAEQCTVGRAPWMRLHLPETNGLDWKLVDQEVRKRCPFPVLCLDLLMQNGEQPPVWVYLKSLQGWVLPPGLRLVVRARPKDVADLSKTALLYKSTPEEDIDVRSRIPNKITKLPPGHEPSHIIDTLRAEAPGCCFEFLLAGEKGQSPGWKELSHTWQRGLPASVLRVKAVPQKKLQETVEVLREIHDEKTDAIRKRRLEGRTETERQPLLGSN